MLIAKNIQVSATIIIIGNEILSGRTKDINTSTIATWLNKLGVRVQEVRVIPDIEEVIVKTINEVRKKNTYVFTTGGIGPTHDDITAESISKAFNLKYEMHKEGYKLLEKYYKPGEFNKGRQNTFSTINPGAPLVGFNINFALAGVQAIFCLPSLNSPGL